jgi:hypothetical protein
MFFVGDSFTPSGIDDYCAQNRNWLGRGTGFDRCLALLEKLRPTHMFNPHVGSAFTFNVDQYRMMRENLAEREKLFGELFPWDHPNYGMDDSWVRCHPYEQQGQAGGEVAFDVVVTNHSAKVHEAACRASGAWTSALVPAKGEARLRLSTRIPTDARPCRVVVPVDVRYGPWTLPQFTEAIVVLKDP